MAVGVLGGEDSRRRAALHDLAPRRRRLAALRRLAEQLGQGAVAQRGLVAREKPVDDVGGHVPILSPPTAYARWSLTLLLLQPATDVGELPLECGVSGRALRLCQIVGEEEVEPAGRRARSRQGDRSRTGPAPRGPRPPEARTHAVRQPQQHLRGRLAQRRPVRTAQGQDYVSRADDGPIPSHPLRRGRGRPRPPSPFGLAGPASPSRLAAARGRCGDGRSPLPSLLTPLACAARPFS